MKRWVGAGLLSLVVVVALPARAASQHLGWCQGVGNPHHNVGCIAEPPPTGSAGTQPPVVTPPQTTSGGGLPPTPGQISTGTGATGSQPYPIPPLPTPVEPPLAPTTAPPVTQQVPTPVPQPQAVPQQVPTPIPPITQQVPTPMPQPQAVPQQVPTLVPPITQQVPTPVPPTQPGGPGSAGTVLTRPRPIPREWTPAPTLAASATIVAPAGPGLSAWVAGPVTAQPGRQGHHALPSYMTGEGEVVHCLAGGFGWRYVPGKDGSTRLVGRLPALRSTDVIVRDVPANQLMSPECVVTVRRRHQE